MTWLWNDTMFQFLMGIRYFIFMFFTDMFWTWENNLGDAHTLTCRTSIFSKNLSVEVFVMLEDPFPVPFLFKFKYISLCFIQWHWNHLQIVDSLKCKPYIFKIISDVMSRLLNSRIAQFYAGSQCFVLWLYTKQVLLL